MCAFSTASGKESASRRKSSGDIEEVGVGIGAVADGWADFADLAGGGVLEVLADLAGFGDFVGLDGDGRDAF